MFTILLIWPRPSTRTLALRVMKFTILVGPSLVIITIHLVCLNQVRRFLKKYINFARFTLKLPSLAGGGHEIYNFLSPYPTDATYQIWLGLAQ